MIAVLGLDLSCASTGVAGCDGRTATLSPPERAVAPRLCWYHDQLARLVRGQDPDVVVIEAYAPRSIGTTSTIRLAELGGVARLVLWRLARPSVAISVAHLKQYATGKGNATKQEMCAAARRAGATPANDDEADAWWLRAIGLAAYYRRDPSGAVDDPSEPNGLRHKIVEHYRWPTIG